MSLQPAPHPVPEHPETHAPLIHGACQSQTAIFQQGTVQRRFRQLRQFSRIPSERSFQAPESSAFQTRYRAPVLVPASP